MAANQDGPSTLEYCNKRFDLIAEATTHAGKAIDERFKHLEQLFTVNAEAAKRAADKVETGQAAHNIAQNEWRGTLNDFKSSTVTRPEFDKFYAEFSAYRLEVARIIAAQTGEKFGHQETKDDSKWLITTIVAIAAAALAVGVMVLDRQRDAPAGPSVVYVPAQPGTLVPSSPAQAAPR